MDEAESIDEFDEDNNVRSVLVTNQPSTCPGDWDEGGDGYVDIDDFSIFADCMAGPDMTMPPPGCDPPDFAHADLNADGDVDLGDFSAFQTALAGNGG